jgi:hypothetical protein
MFRHSYFITQTATVANKGIKNIIGELIYIACKNEMYFYKRERVRFKYSVHQNENIIMNIKHIECLHVLYYLLHALGSLACAYLQF